ncbi:MAG: histidine phosphatase family protein [Anaerolineales bacterium]|nr:histidine phosphatase family protein [Anaerolineales bacterium]
MPAPDVQPAQCSGQMVQHAGGLLVLVKHAPPVIDPALAPAEWVLSEEGRARSRALAEYLRSYPLDAIFHSHEQKAAETASILAARLGLPCEYAQGLQEHARSTHDYTSIDLFHQRVAEFFAQPDSLVFGHETATQARQRFTNAVDRLLEAHPGQSLAIVAHGTVISLLVAERCAVEAFPLWQCLGLPSYIALNIPQWDILHITASIEHRQSATRTTQTSS